MSVKMHTEGDKVFLAACKLAKTLPTRRQWVKYAKQRRGLAYGLRREAEAVVNPHKSPAA